MMSSRNAEPEDITILSPVTAAADRRPVPSVRGSPKPIINQSWKATEIMDESLAAALWRSKTTSIPHPLANVNLDEAAAGEAKSETRSVSSKYSVHE